MTAVPPKAESFKKKGDDSFMKQDYPTAIKCYVAAVSAYPQFDKAWNNMGLAYRESGNLKFAIKCFKRAVQINEDNDFAQANITACEREIEDELFGVKREKRAVKTAPVSTAPAPAKATETAQEIPATTSGPAAEAKPSFLAFESAPGKPEPAVEPESIQEAAPEPVPTPEPEPGEAPDMEPATEIPVATPPPPREQIRAEKIVREEVVGPLGLRKISVMNTVPEEEEEEFECPDCGASIEMDASSCPSCGTEFDTESLDPEIMEKYHQCEAIGEDLENRGRALHMFSGIQDEGLFKIYRVDKYLREAEWEISSGRFDRALNLFHNAENLIDSLFVRYLNSKANDIYAKVRSEVLAMGDYEEHLGSLAKPLFDAERALERDKPEDAIVNTVIIKDYLERLSER